jgi:hypothetical protein
VIRRNLSGNINNKIKSPRQASPDHNPESISRGHTERFTVIPG